MLSVKNLDILKLGLQKSFSPIKIPIKRIIVDIELKTKNIDL